MGDCQLTPRQAEDLLKTNDPAHRKEFEAALHSCGSAMNNDQRFTQWVAGLKNENWKDRNAGGGANLSVPALDVDVVKNKGNSGQPDSVQVADISIRDQGSFLQFALNTRPSTMVYKAPDYGSFTEQQKQPLLSEPLEINDRMPFRSGSTTLAAAVGGNYMLTENVTRKP
jgi:hypothetical protein